MAGNADLLAQVARVLMSRASVPERGSYRRRRPGEHVGLSRRPNAPRLVTIAAAVALTVAGLAVTFHPMRPVLDLLANAGIEPTDEQGYLALLASPALLVLGSFFRGL